MSKRIVTHSGKFHTDDVFAVATLSLLYPDAEVIRTRDEEVIKSGDIVLDVGGIYDETTDRFDHHQDGGAGERANGIPYSSFGLIWKKFGEELSGSRVVMENIDRILVQPIDAADNGKSISSNLIPGLSPFYINGVVNSYRPTWMEGEEWGLAFSEAVKWASSFLKRQIKIGHDIALEDEVVKDAYAKSGDKRIVFIDEKHAVDREFVNAVLNQLPEPVYAVFHSRDNTWRVIAINNGDGTLASRKALPESWRAKRDQDFESASGVEGGIFCHRTGFMCVAKTKEAAIKLAEIALNA